MHKLYEKMQTLWQRCFNHVGLKSFEETQIKEDAYDTKARGVQSVPLKQIVGSVGRYTDFDDQFRLRQHATSDRLERMKELMQGGVPLPPVKLYQIKDDYYVLDGNHRVAAAKVLSYQDIEAQIIEFLPSKTTLENILYREKQEFIEQTGLHHPIELTEVGQYPHLLEQIQRHQHFLAQNQPQAVTVAQAAADWYTTIYQPLVTLIQKGHLLKAFPQRTLADLYTYMSSHQWQKQQARAYSNDIDQLIPNDMEEFRKNMAEKPAFEYPEMQREIIFFVLMTVTAKREFQIIEKLFALKEVQEIHSVHGNVDVIVKVVLSRDLLTSDAANISDFVSNHIRQVPGVISTQTLIPGLSKIKEH
jgi:DNA-binding Lrp family transcriptional regulator